MSSNRSFLDTLNAGRQRRAHASLEDLNRTLEDLENRFGSMREGRGVADAEDRRARRLTDPVPPSEPRATHARRSNRPAPRSTEPAPSGRRPEETADAIASPRREIDRSRQQPKGAGAFADLSEELKALREDMRLQMSTGMRKEFDALRDDLGRTTAQPQAAADGRELAAEMERLSRAIHSMASRSDDRGLEMLRSEMGQVRATLAELAREDTVRSIDDRWSQFEQRADSTRNVQDPAIRALTERLEQIGEAIGNLPDSRALRSLDEKVRTLAGAVDHFSRQSGSPLGSFETIENRLDEISRAIVASTVSGRVMPSEPFERIEARIAALAQQIDDMTVDGGPGELLDRLNGLSRRVEDIALQAALPEKAIERLGRQIGIIYDRLENEPSDVERDRILDSLERRFAEIAALFEERHERATAQGHALMRDMDRRLEEMADRLDHRGAGGLEPALLQALDEKFADLSDRIDGARGDGADPRLLDAFAQRLDSIASRLDESIRRAGDPDPILLQALDEKFADLSDRIDGRGGDTGGRALRALEQRLETIAARMEDTSRQVADIDPHLILGLEKQLAGLTAHLSRPHVEAPDLEVLAPRLDNIERSLADQRDTIVAAAQEAAQRAVASLRASGIDDEDAGALADELRTLESLARKSDERNTRTFEAIHDTLLKVVDRLASLEVRNADIASAYRNRMAPGAVPPLVPDTDAMPLAASTAALASSTTLSGAALAEAPALRAQQPRAAAKAAAKAAAASADAAENDAQPKKSLLGGFARALSGRKQSKAEQPKQQEPTLSGMVEAGLDDPLDSAVVDQPLEPGSGAPDLNAIMRRVRDERTAAPAATDATATGKADFIAAARRAAQAAAAEAQSFRQSDGTEGGKRKFSPSEFLRAKRKPILMAAAAIMMALAGLQLGKAFFADAVRVADKPVAPVSSDASLVASAPAADAAMSESESAAPEAKAVRTVNQSAAAVGEASATAIQQDAAQDSATDDAEEIESEEFPSTAVDADAENDDAASLGFEAAPVDAGPIALREAADAGDPKALFEIGNRYDAGRGVPADRSIAAKWYERAAEQGFAPAQYRIGNFHEKGIGVERDAAKAKTWYQLAAAQGNASAMHNLAVLFAMGTDGAVDNDSAARWFIKAAELGVKDSQYNLGILSAKGLGVPQSLEESYKWFALLAKDGDKDAAAKRDEVANALRPEQLARARAATELWKPKPLVEEANIVDIPEAWQESPGTTASVDMKKAVMTIQLILNKNGYDAGSADGMMGNRTKSAIKAFQKDNGLSPTGEVSDELVKVLLARK